MAARGWIRRLGCAFACGAGLSTVLAASSASAQATCSTAAGTTTYAYDALGQLIGTCNTGNGVLTTYVYDAAGNRTAQIVGLRPTANPVSATVKENTATSIAFNITGGAATSVTIATGPSHGTLGAASTSAVTYTPASNYTGLDSFTYTASNAYGPSQPATVTINVLALPIANNVTANIATGSSNNVIDLVLSGGQATGVAVVTGASHGAVSASGMTISYTPTSTYSGSDSFTYTASNAVGTSSPATASITVSSAYGVWGAFNWGSTAQGGSGKLW